jgi:hypothetical protein
LGGGRSGGSPPAQCPIPSCCPPDLSKIREPLKFKILKQTSINQGSKSTIVVDPHYCQISMRIQIQLFISMQIRILVRLLCDKVNFLHEK